jgi:beta-ketoacyl-acyl-carrier-protein synthase II
MERIVITGMGTINSLAHNVKETWDKVSSGVSGVGPITLFDASDWNVKIASEVKNFDPTLYMDFKEARRRDRFEQLAVAAVKETIQSSGLEINDDTTHGIGVIVSTGIGGLGSVQENIYTLKDQGFRRVSPFAIPMMMPNGAAGMISIDHGIRGPSFSVSSACASGIDGIGIAWMMLRSGMIDVAIAGGSEATIVPVGVGAFDRATAITRSSDWTTNPKPFDRNRDGLVMGEGAALLVLETESHAKARGASILAELAGWSSNNDGYHITAPREDGSGGGRAILKALEIAQVNLDEVDYINAHGTATVLNDAAETTAVKYAFGEEAYQIPLSSTKSMTGHMMGATGALEAIFLVKAINEGILPPTIHYETPDPVCDLDYIPNKAREKKINTAISNSFGFGGHNAVLVVKKYTG